MNTPADQPADHFEHKPLEVLRATVTGRVQGVGFRATAVDIAKRYPVTGRVRNLPDGRVQLLVEGPEAEVSRFLDAVRSHWGKHIERVKTEGREPTGKYRDFAVAR